MTMQSDKNKTDLFKPFKSIWKFFTDFDYAFVFKSIIGVLILVVIYGGLYYYFHSMWMIAVTAAIMVIVLLSSEGQAGLSDYFYSAFFGGIIVAPLLYFHIPIKTTMDNMDLKPYIKTIKLDPNDSNSYILGLHEPFEKEVSVSFYNHSEYIPLFNTSKFYNDFNIVTTKTCKEFRSGTVECTIQLLVDNKYADEGHLIEMQLHNSVYPKSIR